MELKNRTVLVTGAGVRLGQAIAVSLGKQGFFCPLQRLVVM